MAKILVIFYWSRLIFCDSIGLRHAVIIWVGPSPARPTCGFTTVIFAIKILYKEHLNFARLIYIVLYV